MNRLQQYLTDFTGLLFPELCCGCGAHLHHGECGICVACLYDLPYTDYHLHAENRVAKQFWGRLTLQAAMAMLYFKKGTRVQQLIHQLKYKDKTAVGTKLGQLLAAQLRKSALYKDVDLIIPVPLHPKRKRSRGYNQSECIANGLSEDLGIPTSTVHLLRGKATATQTKKSRYFRYENMKSIFKVVKAEQIRHLHVLLVDDVITTGATLEACGQALSGAGIKKISIATIAFAE